MSAFPQFLVRVGAMGSVGRFTAVDPVLFERHIRVVCRTVRGLEMGEVLAHGAGLNGLLQLQLAGSGQA